VSITAENVHFSNRYFLTSTSIHKLYLSTDQVPLPVLTYQVQQTVQTVFALTAAELIADSVTGTDSDILVVIASARINSKHTQVVFPPSVQCS